MIVESRVQVIALLLRTASGLQANETCWGFSTDPLCCQCAGCSVRICTVLVCSPGLPWTRTRPFSRLCELCASTKAPKAASHSSVSLVLSHHCENFVTATIDRRPMLFLVATIVSSASLAAAVAVWSSDWIFNAATSGRPMRAYPSETRSKLVFVQRILHGVRDRRSVDTWIHILAKRLASSRHLSPCTVKRITESSTSGSPFT